MPTTPPLKKLKRLFQPLVQSVTEKISSDDFKTFWAQHHYQPFESLPWWKKACAPLAWAYGVGVEIRNLLYDYGMVATQRVSVPVISIGNLTTGGTGKTPVTMALTRQLQARGLKVVILSRGYGATETLDYGQPTSPAHGDEPWLMQQLLPEAIVIVGKNRAENAAKAIAEFQPDVVILDDGFQYRRLERMVDWVLIDSESGLGNGCLLPLGPLREPVFQLGRATVLAMSKLGMDASGSATHHDLRESLTRRFIETPMVDIPFEIQGLQHWFSRDFIPKVDLSHRSAMVFSGIAQPDRLTADLAAAGVTVCHHELFNDHHVYTHQDLEALARVWDGSSLVITTEKDRVKVQDLIPHAMRPYVYSLILEPVLDDRLLKLIMTQAKLTPTVSMNPSPTLPPVIVRVP